MNAKKKGKNPFQNDLSRIGLFKEMSYLITEQNDKKKKPPLKPAKTASAKNKPVKIMLPSGTKTKGPDQAGYFSNKFLRLSEGDPFKDRPSSFRKENRKKFLDGPFHNAPIVKMSCGKGTCFATINPCYSAMSTAVRAGKQEDFKKAFAVGTGKKGTGYGYLDVTLNKYIPTAQDPIDSAALRKMASKQNKRQCLGSHFKFGALPESWKTVQPLTPIAGNFDRVYGFKPYHHPAIFGYISPPKKPGNMKAGTFNPFPEHEIDPYQDPKAATSHFIDVRNKTKNVYRNITRVAFDRSWPHPSVIAKNLKKSLNAKNYKDAPSTLHFDTCPC